MRPSHAPPVSPVRALAGAAVAVAGVALGIVAVLTLTDDPGNGAGPVVDVPLAQSPASSPAAVPTAAPTSAAPTAVPTTAAPAPPSPAATAPPAPVPPPVPAATTAPAAPSRPAVTVLNNSRITRLADRAAARFEAQGWPVAETGNYRGRLSVTTVYWAAGQQEAAERFAAAFVVPRVLPRPAGLPGSGLTVVLTRDYDA